MPAEEEFSLAPFVQDMRDLLGMSHASAYGLRQRDPGIDDDGDGQALSFVFSAGIDRPVFVETFSGFLQRQPVNWAAYDTSRPEPAQRNTLIVHTGTEISGLIERGLSVVARDVFPVIGVAGREQLRVVVCEGPSMLAWIGGWQPAPFETRQKRILAALVPSLRRRLIVHRQLEHASRIPLLGPMLEAIGNAALVVDIATGRVREANAAARVRLDTERATLRDEVKTAASRGEHPAWTVTAVELRGGAKVALLIARPTLRLHRQVERASKRWSLTARQRQVLGEVAEGHANRTVAAVLGISERTVEVHVTALLAKAQVESRAALIAALHMLD